MEKLDLEPKQEKGVWICPVCGFSAMGRRVVEMHIKNEHKNLLQNKEKKSKKNQKAKPHQQKKRLPDPTAKWVSFKIGDIQIDLLKRKQMKIATQNSWFQHFNIHNYLAYLHKKHVKVLLSNGQEYEGILHARDPFFVQLDLEGGRKLIINKGHIVTVEELNNKLTKT